MRTSIFKTRCFISLVSMFTVLMMVPAVLHAAKATVKKAEVVEETSESNSLEAKNYDIALEVGAWLPGSINVEGYDASKDMSLLFRAFADAYLMPKFAVGCYFNYTSATVEDVDGTFVEFGISLKPRFFMSPVVAIKPGLNIGYRNTSVEGQDSADGLGVNLSVELQYLIGSDYTVFGDFGFLTQPTGGNDVADITWAPIFYIAGGICF